MNLLSLINNRSFRTRKDEARSYEKLPESFCERHIDIADYTTDNIALMKNFDLGAIYSIRGIYDEVLDMMDLEEKLQGLFKAIRSMATGIPSHLNKKNIVIQVIMKQREIKKPLEKVLGNKPFNFRDDVVGEILKEEELQIFSRGLIKRDLYISIRYSPTRILSKNSILNRIFGPIINPQITQLSNDISEFDIDYKQFLLELTNFERQFDYPVTRLDKLEFMAITQNMLHFGEDKPIFPDETRNISSSLYAPNYCSGLNQVKETDSEKSIFTYHLNQLPSQYGFGKIRHFIESIPCRNIDLVWCFSHGSKEYGKDLKAREVFYERKIKSTSEFDEFLFMKNNVSSTRPHGIQSLRLIVYNPPENLPGVIESYAQDFIGGRMIRESQIPTHMFATSLPLNCTSEGNRLKGRSSRIRLENALGFLPIYVGPECKSGIRHYISRQLTPTTFDLFAGEGNKITVILGASRSGKSVFDNNLIMDFSQKFPHGVVRVIDIKTSYQKLCDLVGGKIIRFSEEELRRKTYSPFALGEDYDNDDIEAIYLLITTAILQKNPGIEFSAIHSELLREALKIAYNSNLITKSKFGIENAAPHPIWEDVLSSLPIAEKTLKETGISNISEASRDISGWSINLYETGQFGFIFNRLERNDEKTSECKLLVYDLDGNTDPVLRQLSAMMAFIKITRDLAKLPTSTPKLIVFEEFGILLNGEGAAEKINEENIKLIVKTTAKLNAQPVAITNNVDDFAVKSAGKVFWENSTQRVFLPVGSMYENAYAAWKNQFSEGEWQIIKTLRMENEYKRSSALILSENVVSPYKGSIYLPLSPLMDALTTTSGSQTQLYKDLLASGKSPKEAQSYMAENHPYGLGL